MKFTHAEIEVEMKDNIGSHDTGNLINGEPEYDCEYEDADVPVDAATECED